MGRSKFPKMKWKTSRYRRDKRTGPIKVIGRSDYLKMMFEKERLDEQPATRKLGR